jgi:hypothetical protein
MPFMIAERDVCDKPTGDQRDDLYRSIRERDADVVAQRTIDRQSR